MTEYRLLSPETDYEKLKSLMNHYFFEEEKSSHRVYPLESTEATIKNNLALFEKSSTDNIKNGFLVGGEFCNGELIGFSIGRKLNHIWNIEQTVVPSWVLVLLYSKNKAWKSPKQKVHMLLSPVISVMESEKFYSWYKVSKISNKLNSENVDQYLSEVYSRTINTNRYSVTIEAVVNNQEELNKLKSVYRKMFPVQIYDNRKLALMCHHFKNSLRTF